MVGTPQPGDAARACAVKVCGVTRVEDAILALDLGARLVGLNFYPPSPRYLTPPAAADLIAAARCARPDRAEKVRWAGVFVNETPDHVAGVARTAGLDLVQLHGDEMPGPAWAALAPRILRVFRVSGRVDHDDLLARMAPWRKLPATAGPAAVWGFLIDTLHDELYGGSGESWDFASLVSGDATADDSPVDLAPRLLLAGGLGPDNAAAVVRTCRPWGIDLCSGIESTPGHKDPDLMRRLFEAIEAIEETDDGTTRSAA